MRTLFAEAKCPSINIFLVNTHFLYRKEWNYASHFNFKYSNALHTRMMRINSFRQRKQIGNGDMQNKTTPFRIEGEHALFRHCFCVVN